LHLVVTCEVAADTVPGRCEEDSVRDDGWEHGHGSDLSCDGAKAGAISSMKGAPPPPTRHAAHAFAAPSCASGGHTAPPAPLRKLSRNVFPAGNGALDI
jgi:hypothetical protein